MEINNFKFAFISHTYRDSSSQKEPRICIVSHANMIQIRIRRLCFKPFSLLTNKTHLYISQSHRSKKHTYIQSPSENKSYPKSQIFNHLLFPTCHTPQCNAVLNPWPGLRGWEYWKDSPHSDHQVGFSFIQGVQRNNKIPVAAFTWFLFPLVFFEASPSVELICSGYNENLSQQELQQIFIEHGLHILCISFIEFSQQNSEKYMRTLTLWKRETGSRKASDLPKVKQVKGAAPRSRPKSDSRIPGCSFRPHCLLSSIIRFTFALFSSLWWSIGIHAVIFKVVTIPPNLEVLLISLPPHF